METYSFWDGQVWHAIFLIFSNAALIPSIAVLAYLGDVTTALLLIDTFIESCFYHMCRAGVVCLFRYEMHKMADYLSVYRSIGWMITRLGIHDPRVHIFAFFFCNIITQAFVLAEAPSFFLPVIGVGLPVTIALVHAVVWRRKLFYHRGWTITAFVLAGIGGLFMFAAPDGEYWWAHAMWHFFEMLVPIPFIIATNPTWATKPEFHWT